MQYLNYICNRKKVMEFAKTAKIADDSYSMNIV